MFLPSDKATASKCGRQFAAALALEGIEKQKITNIYTELLKEIAYKDITAAFHLLVEAPVSSNELKAITDQLTASQQQEIRKISRQVIDDFYAEYNGQPKPDVVLEKKKEIEKATPPSDPCQREIWELSIKPGYYISGNGKVAYVRDYSCAANTYTIAWLDRARSSRLVMETLSVDAMRSYHHTSSAPFLICSHCKGQGYSLEYDWYQVNVASNYYARSNDQRKYTCGVCSGAGYIKVR